MNQGKLTCGRSLRPVLNATGVILHTNLGRAPLGAAVIAEVAAVAAGYSNLEFDLEAGRRGDRNVHLRELLRVLTGAEDVLVVNNNAAAVMLVLNTLACGREVIVSRGELVEIGGSFRIPEIMAASGARMVEVGTTNRTRLEDYEGAIGPDTAMLFKVHQANYSIEGSTAEVTAAELATLARARGLPLCYDLGSGLLRRPAGLPLAGEPEVAASLAEGADLVTFSCDKLLGGPQAGVVAGRSELVRQIGSVPMMRALRVGKLTIAALSVACRQYLSDESLLENNPTFAMLSRESAELARLAGVLAGELERLGVSAREVESFGQCGGGALPDVKIPSRAVEVLPREGMDDAEATFAERIYDRLQAADLPVLGILREGRLLLDVLALNEDQLAPVAQVVSEAIAAEAEAGS
jgi:L-seryl-tRNA(Ser) seleniumtransferase